MPGITRFPAAPYRPDFNVIENAFWKLKAMLRTRAERRVDGLGDAVGASPFPFAECTTYFRVVG